MKLLIITDYQVDNVTGVLGFPKAPLILDKIINIIPNYDNFIILKEEYEVYENTFMSKVIDSPHCIKNTDGSLLYSSLKEYESKALKVFTHENYSSIELGNYLKTLDDIESIDICGVSTHTSVLTNAIICKTAIPSALITVLRDAVASFDSSLEKKAYDILNSLQIEYR